MRTLPAISLIFAIAQTAVADVELPIPDEQYVHCTVCHGVQMMGNPVIGAPRLSGMDNWYVENQLRSFKKGWRGRHGDDLSSMEMRPMAAALTDEQIKEVAAFVAATRSDPPAQTIEGNSDNGQRLFATCAACHGMRAEGNIALGSPPLTGLNDWYLVKQLRNFKNGTRGGRPGDTYGMQMRSSAGLLTDDQATLDVVAYISTLNDQ